MPQVELRSVDEVAPYERNAKTHPREQIEQIKGAMRRFGFTQRALIDESGTIIAGHGRHLAALDLWNDGETLRLPDGRDLPPRTIPVIVARGWSDEQRRAYTIADNRLTESGGWDEDLLRIEIADLGLEADVDLAHDMGFDAETLAAALSGQGGGREDADPDEMPDPPEVPVTKRGDVWLLGKHRLRCGDSTDADDVAALLNGMKPHLMVTDPPYGVNYDPDWRNRSSIGWSQSRSTGLVKNDDRASWAEAYALFPGEVAYVWHPPGANSVKFYNDLEASGFEVRMQIIWAKPHFPVGRGNYHVQHEPCWYAVRKKAGATAHWQGSRKETTLWHIDNFSAKGGKKAVCADAKTGHGTQKPIECMRRPIVNNSRPGDAIYEPFCGSGTTIIAAEMEGRRVYAMELDERYCDVIVRRWQDFTGQRAIREGDGVPFDEASDVG